MKGGIPLMERQKLLNINRNRINANIYVDYENIVELLKRYGKNPLEIGFFPVILHLLKDKHKFNIIESIIYNNFEKKSLDGPQQSILQSLGLQTRHSSNAGKNSSDLELTVDALRTLYKNPVIDVFVIISSDRDIIPLLKAIKYENKITYVISTKIGFNEIVIQYADYHDYIEELFGLNPKILTEEFETKLNQNLDSTAITETDIGNAKEVSILFYNSNVWKNYESRHNPVNLNGYVQIAAKTINRMPDQITDDFKLAHHLKYITLFQDSQKGLCIKKGEKRNEVIALL
jgi:uncharacterized LabA/DUF88 family protein